MSYYRLKWQAGARPPAHPKPMIGRQEFASIPEAVAFMSRQAPDAEFISLTEVQTIETDASEQARALLGDRA